MSEPTQPLGAFGFPAGLLLIPGGDGDVAAVRERLVQGELPESWPAALEGHRLVHEGDWAEAQAAFTGDDGVAIYHRWLLDPESAAVDQVRLGLPSAWAGLVDVVAYTIGRGECPDYAVAGLPSEVGALVLASQATALIEQGNPASAAELLLTASDHCRTPAPALSAVLRGNAGTMLHELGDARAEETLTTAIGELTTTDLDDVRAELLYHHGALLHEQAVAGPGETRSQLQQAMKSYYQGLSLISETSAPFLWANLNLNLATAQLAMPMSQATDQLRLGVATASLRAARRVFAELNQPEAWSTATLNLANALVYTPSTHQGDNLVEAVELYEAVLSSGARDGDPLGRARLLANQGNALAHLGVFDHARAKLVEARFIFEEHLDHESAMSVRGVLDEIAKQTVPSHDSESELAELARVSEQMSKIPTPQTHTSGMGVTVTPAPTPKITVLKPGQAHPSLPVEDRGLTS